MRGRGDRRAQECAAGRRDCTARRTLAVIARTMARDDRDANTEETAKHMRWIISAHCLEDNEAPNAPPLHAGTRAALPRCQSA
jgi:hypothetical protein